MGDNDGMIQSVDALREVVLVNGELMWQVSGGGVCVHSKSGAEAMELFRAQCQRKGIWVDQ